MNKFELLIEKAKQKNLSVYFEEHKEPHYMFKGFIGIENKNHIVYWYEYTEDGYLNYHHAYNCNNGTKVKGYAIGYNFLSKLLNN